MVGDMRWVLVTLLCTLGVFSGCSGSNSKPLVGTYSVQKPGPNFKWEDESKWTDETRGDTTWKKIWRWGTLTTPLAPEEAGSPNLTISVWMRLAPVQPAPLGTMLVHCGGPGGDAMCVFGRAMAPGVDVDLLNKYNLFGIDQRGVSTSGMGLTPARKPSPDLACTNYSNKLPEVGQKYTSLEPFTECACAAMGPSTTVQFGGNDWNINRFKSIKEAGETCRGMKHLQMGNYNVLDYIGTTYLAFDLDRLREALGEEKLHIYGVSYGTWVGAVYASQYPERTGKVILDSNLPPAPNAFRFSEQYTQNHQKMVTEFMRRCGAIECMGKGVDPEEEYLKAVKALEAGTFTLPTDFDNVTLTHMYITQALHGTLRDHTPRSPTRSDEANLVFLTFAERVQELVGNISTPAAFMNEILKDCSLTLNTTTWWSRCKDKNGKELGYDQNTSLGTFKCPTWKQYGICAYNTGSGAGTVLYGGVMAADTPSRYLPTQMDKMTQRLYDMYGPIGQAGSYIMELTTLFPSKSTYAGIGTAKVEPLIIGVLEDSATAFAWSQEQKLAFPNSAFMTWQGYHHGMPNAFNNVALDNPTGIQECHQFMKEYITSGTLPRNGEACHENVKGIDFDVDGFGTLESTGFGALESPWYVV